MVSEKTLVVQSNKLIEAKYRLSVEEQKIVKILISQIQREDRDFQDYEFHIRELAEMLGMTYDNPYVVLRNITKKLMTRVLEFYNPETGSIIQASWLSSAEYKKGFATVALCFDPKLKPLLLQLKSYFTKYELGQVMQFRGQYTIRFFEFRKSFLGRNKKEVVFSLKELWETLGLKKEEYKIFRDFKNRVLEPARLELLEKTGQSFSWEAIRKGRGGKVVGVRFVFDGEVEKVKEAVVVLESKPETESQQVQKKPERAKSPVVEPESVKREMSEAVRLLLDCGISESVAVRLAEGRETDYIREKVSVANAHPEYVKNKAGFLVQAIRENWVDDDIVRMRQEERRLNAQKHALERRKRLKGIWDRYRVQRDALGLKEYEKKTDEERERIKSEFLGGLNAVIRNIYRKKETFGYEDHMFRSFFLGKLELPSFDWFLVLEGITLSGEEREILEKEVGGR